MMTFLNNLEIANLITAAIVTGNWMWCVYIEHWNPSNMKLNWFAVIVFEALIWLTITMVQKIVRKLRSRKYITKRL